MPTTRAKIVFFGDAQVGKTELQKKLFDPKAPFNPDYRATIGVDFRTENRGDIILQIWDFAGQKRFKSLSTSFAKNANFGIFSIDLSTPLNRVEIQEELEFFKKAVGQEIPVILVGTKLDLERKVSDEDFQQVIDENPSIISAFKVSTKTNEGLKDLLDTMLSYAKPTVDETLVSRDAFKVSSIDKALAQLPQSELYLRINVLKAHIAELSPKTQDLIGLEILELINKLKLKESPEFKTQAIEEFEAKSIHHLGGSYPKIKSAIIGIAITAVITVLAALVGFGIGFLAGAWTGPGAFISGFIAGSAAAVSVVSASTVVGTSLGIFGGIRNYHNLMNLNELVHDIADYARC